jgi:hypothetical protein
MNAHASYTTRREGERERGEEGERGGRYNMLMVIVQ